MRPLLFTSLAACLCLSLTSCSKKNTPPAPTSSSASSASSASGATPSSVASGLGLGLRDAAVEARPLYYDRKITTADLEGRTLRELALMRNMPFARGGKKFRKPWLNDYFTKQSWYQPKDSFDESTLSSLDRDNAQLIADYETKLGHDELQRRADALHARADASTSGSTPNDVLELQLLSIRLGRPQGSVESDVAAAAGSATPPPEGSETRSPLEDPTSLDRLITVKELDALSPRDLRILRNTIYARRGRPFKSPLLDAYFKSMDWYKPDPAYSDKRLTAIDQKNIKIVRSVEDTLGGPMTDSQEAQWFGGA